MSENGRFWQIYRRFAWFQGAGGRRQAIVSLFSRTFLEAGGWTVGRKASDSRVFWQTLAVLPPPRRTDQGEVGDLGGCLLAGLSSGRRGLSVRANVGPEADAARREARATSERPNLSDRRNSTDRPHSRCWHGKLRDCSTCLAAGFIFEGPPRLPWFYLDSRPHGERRRGC